MNHLVENDIMTYDVIAAFNGRFPPPKKKNFLKIIWKLIVSSINSQKIRKFCVWESMVAIVFKNNTRL